MLTAICALMIPYFFSHPFTSHRIDLSWKTINSMVLRAEPAAIIQSSKGASELVEMTCLIPTANSDVFFSRLHAEVKRKLDASGWTRHGSSEHLSNGLLTWFSYDLQNTSSRCSVVGVLLDRKKGTDVLYNKDVDEVRFIILSPHVR